MNSIGDDEMKQEQTWSDLVVALFEGILIWHPQQSIPLIVHRLLTYLDHITGTYADPREMKMNVVIEAEVEAIIEAEVEAEEMTA